MTERPRYRTRKGDVATNVLGVCSPDMQFIYVLPGWEGSAADGRVLRDAICRRNGLQVPNGMSNVVHRLLLRYIMSIYSLNNYEIHCWSKHLIPYIDFPI